MSNMKMMSQEELFAAIEQASERAADHAVEKVLLFLGVDSRDPSAVGRLRGNLAYLEQQRISQEEARALIKNSAATILTAAFLTGATWVWVVFKGGLHDWVVSFISK